MSNAGRPTVVTPAVVSLLVASFHSGLSVREACWQSDISHEAYYSRLRSDEQFADTMAKAQSDITMAAKKLVAKEVRNGNVQAVKWWLERNKSLEVQVEANEAILPAQKATEEQTNKDIATLDRLIGYKKQMIESQKKGYIT